MSPSGLHSMRLMVERYCVTPCTLYRGGVLLTPQPTMRDGSPLRCRIKDDKQTRIEGADATQTMMRWLITLPNSVDVRDQDHLRTRDREYTLAPIANPDSDSPRNKCYAYALYPLDANGNPGAPLYLRFNAVVTTKRGGVAVLTDADAERVSQEIAYTPDGQVVNTVFKLVYPIDVREGDSLTDSGYPAGIVRLVTPSPKGLPTTTILVVRPVV